MHTLKTSPENAAGRALAQPVSAAISRRRALKTMGVAVPTALVAARGIMEAPRAEALTTGPALTYSVKNDGGLSANGTYDDQSVQRCVNAAAANYGGTIVVDVPVIFGSGSVAVKMPAKGAYAIVGAGQTASFLSVNDGYPPGEPVPSIQVTASIGGQPSQLIGTGTTCIFDCTAADPGLMTVRIDNLLMYGLGSWPFAACITNNVWMFDFDWNTTAQVGGVACVYAGGGQQTQRLNMLHNLISNHMLVWCPSTASFGGDISGNVVNEPGDLFIPSGISGVVGSIIHTENFPTWMIHDNFFFSQQLSSSKQRATICYQNLNQTQDGSIHHNVFYGAGGMCIYYKDDFTPGDTSFLTGGLVIDGNEFVGWNMCNISTGPGANGSALVIDTSSGSPADQLVLIGKNIWQGGRLTDAVHNYSKRCIEVVQGPDTAHVVFDVQQVMRYVTVAGWRINGVDYVTSFPSHRFRAALAAPTVPATSVALTNPFGFDCTVYVSGRNLNDVAIDGVATGLKSGMFRVPRCATITLTYSSPPTWKWFAD
jgi:hypothetical protein